MDSMVIAVVKIRLKYFPFMGTTAVAYSGQNIRWGGY